MLEDKSKSFEEIFNEWYKKFLEEEKLMNEEIKTAKLYRDEKLSWAKREATDTIKSYELEQKDKLDAEKEKVNASRNNFEQIDNDYNNQVVLIQQDFKQNKDKVIEFLLENILNVGIELPENIKSGTKTFD